MHADDDYTSGPRVVGDRLAPMETLDAYQCRQWANLRAVQRWLAEVLGPGEERSRRVVTEADFARIAESLRVDRGALAESWGLAEAA